MVVFGAAAYTVGRDGKSQEVGRGSAHLVAQPKKGAPMF